MSNVPINDMSFEAALDELENIVSKMESGQTSLEQSIQAYERGVALKQHCEKRLKDATLKIEQLSLNNNGEPEGTTPYNPEI